MATPRTRMTRQNTAVVADRVSHAPGDALRLPPLTRDLSISFTALSFTVPQKVRFRYQLEGHDADWVDPGARRQAVYGDLGPGDSRFRVIAANNDGVWNATGATLRFTVAPAWFQTAWVRLAALILVVGLVWAIYRLRVRQIAVALGARFEAQLAERMRIANDLHDTLLQSTAAALLHVELADDALTRDAPSTTTARERALPSLKRATQILSGMNAEGRDAVQGLRAPSASGDLADTLRQTGRDQPNSRDVDLRVTVEGSVRALQPLVSEEIHRIAREALVNAYQHANAQRIDVDLAYTRTRFRCVVRDDGCGIETRMLQRGREGHYGLAGMRERAARVGAELHVRSVAGGGTEVELRVKGRLAFGDARPMGRVRQWLRLRWFRPRG